MVMRRGHIGIWLGMILLIFSAAYREFGGWWGLFLVICTGGLVIATMATAAASCISLEEWLEEKD